MNTPDPPSNSSPNPSPQPNKPKHRKKIYVTTPVAQALELQRIIMDRCRRPEIKGSVLAALVRSWSELEDRKRILRGIPLPEVAVKLDPIELARRLKRRALPAPQPTGNATPFIEIPPEPPKPEGIS